jgi:hypothetical protein
MAAVVHVVLVQWRTGVSDEVRSRIRAASRGMAKAIPGILALEEGPSVSPEGLESGFDWALVVTFADEEARDRYLPHPSHTVVGEQIGANAERLVVFDVLAGRPSAS